MAKKIKELDLTRSDNEDSRVSELLKTIRLPKGNLHYLTDRLPKSNYKRELEERVSFYKNQTSPDRQGK